MRQINVDIVVGFDENKKPIVKTVKETIYTISELPMLGKLLSCKDSTKRGVNYLNIPCSFDIETTNIYQRDSEGEVLKEPRPYAFMYHWQFCLDDCVCFGRTWEEFKKLIDELQKRMNLSLYNRLVVWVHNLNFEWTFMNRFINYQEGFFRDDNEPLKIVTAEGIEFRCSQALSNMSLIKFCENEKVKHYKLVDTYDYEKIRLPTTPLTEEEEAYCYNDVRGLCECIESRLKHDTITSIPMTSTGYVRRDMREAVKGDKKYRKKFRDNALDKHLYQFCRDAFRGGDTHANIDYSRQTLTNIKAKDETSAYPACMMMDLYPMTAFFQINVSTFMNRDLRDYALLLEVRFIGLKYIGNCGIPYVPISKLKNDPKKIKKVVDNGRILEASMAEMVLTDIDYSIILEEYTFDDLYIREVWASRYEPLSDNIKNVVMDYYRKKTLLKDDPSMEYEYNKSKNSLNSTYGCMVQRIDMTTITYNPDTHEYIPQPIDLEEVLAKFYKSRNNFLSYQHGVWITANARLRLRKMLWQVGEDVVYCDTDSIKYRGDHEQLFIDRNAEIIKEAEAVGACAETLSGKVKYLGIWDDDKPPVYEKFRTLGAKKYVYQYYDAEKDKHIIKSTIAGVSKKSGAEYFSKHGVDGFDIGKKILRSGHLTAYYNDEDIHTITVKGVSFTTASNVAIIDGSYTIGVTGEYLNLLEKALAKQSDVEYI
jgi:hypothetical protein